MNTTVSKATWFLLSIAGIAVLIFVAAARPGRDRPVTVGIVHPSRQDLNSWTTGNGKIEPIDARIIQSQLTTRIESVNVTEGRTVRAGEPLLVLDATDARSELARMREQLLEANQDKKMGLAGGSPDDIAQVESDLQKINAELTSLHQQQEQLGRLYSQQAATRFEIDQNRIALEKADAEKRMLDQKRNAISERSTNQAERASLKADEARESIQSLEGKINSARVVAPIAGTIYSLSAKTGTFVHVGDPLAELADLRQVRVRAFIDEPELGSLREGQPVEITWGALPGKVWLGVVDQLPKAIVTRGSRNVGEVLCSVDNRGAELLPNTNVDVRIRTAERKNALTVPRAAVHSEGSKRYVFTVVNDRLRKQEVAVGISDPNIYQVLDGITERNAIAVQADADLREGQLVTGSQ
jgi:HlyD family secretion protein